MSPGYDFQAFRQDLAAAVEAFRADNFDAMNVFANRIMSNAVIGGNRKLALPGFFLKDIAFDFGNLKALATTATFSTAKSLADQYVSSLAEKSSESDFDENQFWADYHRYLERTFKYAMDEFEGEAYKTANPEFTHKSFIWLIQYLDRHKDTLLDPKNLLIKGVHNEMSRLLKVHGGEVADTYAISLIIALDRCNDYIRATASEDAFPTRVKDEIMSYVEKIVQMFSGSGETTPEPDSVNSTLWELIYRWREYFLQYMERPRRLVQPEKGIELPEETRKKLTEAITKALESETKPKRRE